MGYYRISPRVSFDYCSNTFLFSFSRIRFEPMTPWDSTSCFETELSHPNRTDMRWNKRYIYDELESRPTETIYNTSVFKIGAFNISAIHFRREKSYNYVCKTLVAAGVSCFCKSYLLFFIESLGNFSHNQENIHWTHAGYWESSAINWRALFWSR